MITSSTCANLAQVADNGKAYNYKFYGLKAVIAVGYKVNSQAAVEFPHHETNLIPFLIACTIIKSASATEKNTIEICQNVIYYVS